MTSRIRQLRIENHPDKWGASVLCLLVLCLVSSAYAQLGTGANPVAAEPVATTSIFALATAPTTPKQLYLTWDIIPGSSNRVEWGTVRNAWTNGFRVVTTNVFPITNGWCYAVKSVVNGVESIPALWPSNRIGEIWLTGMGTNFTVGTNIQKLCSFTNQPPGNMQFWGVKNITTGWE